MAHQFNFPSQANVRLRQGGAVLILIAFILGLGAAAYLLKAYNSDTAKAKQDEKTYQALSAAKQALIAWAVSHPNTPGLMPYPDRNGDGNYDDTSDCYASNVNFAPSFTIGRLPLFKSDPNCVNAKNAVNTGLAGDFRDGTGERLWYEVSKNLLHDYKDNGGNPNGTSPIINPGILDTPSNPWFVVRDRNGAVISNRVAAVIIAPGAPIGAQDRSGGIAAANQYLDKIVMASGMTYKNYTYQDFPAVVPIQEFIIGDDFRMVAKNDPTYKNQTIEPYYYNDKLVYITIDELMSALERRVASEVTAQLINYKKFIDNQTPITPNDGYFPYAAIMGGSKNYSCINGQLAGALPIRLPHSSSCTYTGISSSSSNASCSFTEVATISFTKTLTNFTGSSGACQFIGRVCTCDGAGSCTRAAQTFSCSAAGACSANMAGTYKFLGGGFDSVTGQCATTCGSDITCTGNGGGVFSHSACSDSYFNDLTTNSKLPVWFIDNLWQDYVYYELTRPANPAGIKVGAKFASATIVMAGSTISAAPFAAKGAAQTRPSCIINDYLDSAENVSTNSIYDATSKQHSANYNDQIFVVEP
ncbi:MAG: hypothetical protein Q8K83_02795 [Methylotenera sp.]|nr:hypothetical protein [Methylotenera sp.]